MSDPLGPLARRTLAREYGYALRDFLSGAGEAALTRAYELGRMAAVEGIGILDLAAIHHEALAGLAVAGSDAASERVMRAGQFLAEMLSPFEMNLRALRANVRLLGLSESLAQENREIGRAHQQLRTILDATTAVIYLKDTEGRYLFVNRAFEAVFGRRGQEVIGRLDGEVMPSEVAETLRASDAQVLLSRTPQELEQHVLEADGMHTFLALKFPLLGDDGSPYGLCCVATDITERKHQIEALKRAKEAAESANRELESFSYSVAHDLRAPLRSIDGFSQALLEDFGDKLDDQGKTYIGYVRESAQHMAQLIDGLLALSRVSRAELDRQPVDLSAICRKIAARPPAADRRVEFAIQDGVVARGDVRMLRAVLENLLGNAWKFTSKRPVARIEFGAKREVGRPPIYFVRDNGVGFDMAYGNKLFGVFQRLHRPDEFEGNGIGLATVHRIVRRHGGRVWGEAEVDRGATFYFTLEEESAA